jgi:hypothetical protein
MGWINTDRLTEAIAVTGWTRNEGESDKTRESERASEREREREREILLLIY